MSLFDPVVTALVIIATSFLVNKYTAAMGFWVTALAWGIVAGGLVVHAVRSDQLTEVLGPIMTAHPKLFLVSCVLLGGLVFGVGGLFFLRTYEKLERKRPASYRYERARHAIFSHEALRSRGIESDRSGWSKDQVTLNARSPRGPLTASIRQDNWIDLDDEKIKRDFVPKLVDALVAAYEAKAAGISDDAVSNKPAK
jgi:hypothetical protein